MKPEEILFAYAVQGSKDDLGNEIPAMRAEVLRAIEEARALRNEYNFLRPEVRAFAKRMEQELRNNDHKPGWKDRK